MAQTASFPEIVPTTRRFRMGDIPSTTYTSLSGVVFKRAFGNKKTGYTLDLTFVNIPDTSNNSRNTQKILDHYEDVKGTFSTFALSSELFSGMQSGVSDYVKVPSNVEWRYAKPPEVQSVQSNLSTVTVNFIGELQA